MKYFSSVLLSFFFTLCVMGEMNAQLAPCGANGSNQANEIGRNVFPGNVPFQDSADLNVVLSNPDETDSLVIWIKVFNYEFNTPSSTYVTCVEVNDGDDVNFIIGIPAGPVREPLMLIRMGSRDGNALSMAGFGQPTSQICAPGECQSDCDNDVVMNDDPIVGGEYHYNSILSSGRIDEDSIVTLKAAESITLNAGFIAENGSTLLLKIEDCSSSAPLVSGVVAKMRRNEVEKTFSNLKVYPNPVTTSLIHIEGLSGEENLLTLFTITGQILSTKMVRDVSATVDVSEFSSGIYFLGIEDNEGRITKKVTIQK